MKINYVVVHELQKEVNRTGASLKLSSNLLDIDENCIELITELNKRYSALSITYANFVDDEFSIFPREFCTYYEDRNEATFLNFSNNTIKKLKDIVKNNAPSKGGYLVFADYEDHGNFVGIFLIRNTTGKLFEQDTKTLNFKINTSVHIDFEKMAMACRINTDFYSRNEGRCLSFIKKGNADISNYFIEWISCSDKEDNTKDTLYLKEMLDVIPAPFNECGESIDRDDFREKVYKQIKNNDKSYVDLKILGKVLYDDEKKFTEFAQERELPINTEFKANPKILKKIINVNIKADHISLDFPHRYLNEKVIITPDLPNTIIINSSILAEKLRTEMDDNE